MALLEDLIKDIADARLRNQIAGEVSKLKTGKKFNLVFEQHLPEIVQLPGLLSRERAGAVKLAMTISTDKPHLSKANNCDRQSIFLRSAALRDGVDFKGLAFNVASSATSSSILFWSCLISIRSCR
jgi:hypothetical protein